jgi:hypothetical protein
MISGLTDYFLRHRFTFRGYLLAVNLELGVAFCNSWMNGVLHLSPNIVSSGILFYICFPVLLAVAFFMHVENRLPRHQELHICSWQGWKGSMQKQFSRSTFAIACIVLWLVLHSCHFQTRHISVFIFSGFKLHEKTPFERHTCRWKSIIKIGYILD